MNNGRSVAFLIALLCLASTDATAAAAEAGARVIVKYRPTAALLRKQVFSSSAAQTHRVQTLGTRIGAALRVGPMVGDRIEVVLGAAMSSDDLAARLAADPDIEYAVADRLRQHYRSTNDPLYLSGPTLSDGSGGPASGQWYLRAATADVPAAIDAEGAWEVSFGHDSVVVAVVDTGVLFDHPDLRPVAEGGNLLPGFDMISELQIANDGNGRDADAADPGDWQTSAEASSQCGFPCAGSDSSWHGTQTSGLIAALTDNDIGMASVARRVRILPVRVLGKGGGFDSDIIAGMRWAAGLNVPGVASNTRPARVLNLSLGAFETCDSAYRDAVAEITAAGALIVASAGNSAGHAVSTPANCPGVLAVAALRHVGSKVGFSDIGPEIAISAPGGNCVNVGPGQPCLFPIVTTTNTGTTAPIAASAGGATYSDAFNPSLGTSFSAPIVAGTVALLLSVNPSLTGAEIRSLLQRTARPFPTTGAQDPFQTSVPTCTGSAPIGFSQIDQLQCYCTTATCGAGMLDAGAALRAASGLRARINLSSANLRLGRASSFSASASLVPAGHTIVSYNWRVREGAGNVALGSPTDRTMVSATPTQSGNFTLGLTLIDNTGLRASTEAVFAGTAGTVRILDVDNDGRSNALTDGVLVVRYLFGFSGAALTNGATDAAGLRTDPAAVLTELERIRPFLDVDGNGDANALTDGVLMLRYLFGFSGSTLLDGALSADATRRNAADLQLYLQSLVD